MITLSRTVRFSVNARVTPEASASALSSDQKAVSNGFGGMPSMVGLGAHYELHITATGEPDPTTGYFLDIKVIDRAARLSIIPLITKAFQSEFANLQPPSHPTHVLRSAMPELADALGGTLASARWNLSPTYSVEMQSSSPTTALLRQRFEIAAAHRLYVPALSDQQNFKTFGKCSNPSGHGHNYVIEPAVRVTLPTSFTLEQLESLVDQHILQPFDHKHLNVDCAEFDISKGGVNPSVENISKVFFDKLAGAIASASPGATLHSMTVFETEKTSSTYPA